QGFDTGAYDIILAPNWCHRDVDVEAVLEHILQLLKDGSWLLFGRQGQSASEWAEWRAVPAKEKDSSYGSNSESPLSIVWRSENIAVLRKNSTSLDITNHRQEKQIVLIIDPAFDAQVKFADRIAGGFSERIPRYHVDVQSLDQAALSQAKGNVVFIVLLDLGSPFLYNMSETTYHSFQALVIAASDIVWIGVSEQGQPRKPEFAIIDGLARVMRNEKDDYQFTTVFFECHSYFSDQQLEQFLEVLDRNHFRPDPDAINNEPEFFEIDGRLNIPRLIRRNEQSRELHARSLPQRLSVRSVHNAPPVMLTVGSPGLLDTLHFVEDIQSSKPLAQGE
ncbi:MAG: hypothetical protein Q9180_009790, partial [Flavoplaca navasiana]